MRLILACVGRAKAGDERRLADRYLQRAVLAGRAAGLTVELRELPDSRARTVDMRKAEEARALIALRQSRDVLAVFDERGSTLTSAGLAGLIATARDYGASQFILAIGGADGHDEALRASAQHCIAFGACTWPHQLMRVLAAEQIYRATTILTGHPYHRA